MHDDCYHKMYSNEEHHWWFKAKVDIVRELAKKYTDGNFSNKKVLDAGCGTSFLAKSIIPARQNIYSVDGYGLSLYYSKKRGMKNIVQSDLNSMPFENGVFDLAFCMDVIEHNKNDQYLVNELSRVMKSGGVMIASVPALMSLWSPQDVKLEHFKRYKLEDFSKLFEKDFEILKASYCNTLLFPPIYALRKIFNLFPSLTKNKDEIDMNSGLVNDILYGIFRQESKLLKHVDLPIGVSSIVVVRKR